MNRPPVIHHFRSVVTPSPLTARTKSSQGSPKCSGAVVLPALLAMIAFIGSAVGAGQRIRARYVGVPIQLRSAPITVSIPVQGDSWAIQAAGDRGQLALDLQDVEFNGPPEIYYDIYLDLPAEVKNPGSNSVNLIGRLTPLAERRVDPGSASGARISYSIADVVHALTISRAWNPDVMTITFVPRSLGGGQGITGRVSTVRARIGRLLIVSAN